MISKISRADTHDYLAQLAVLGGLCQFLPYIQSVLIMFLEISVASAFFVHAMRPFLPTSHTRKPVLQIAQTEQPLIRQPQYRTSSGIG